MVSIRVPWSQTTWSRLEFLGANDVVSIRVLESTTWLSIRSSLDEEDSNEQALGLVLRFRMSKPSVSFEDFE